MRREDDHGRERDPAGGDDRPAEDRSRDRDESEAEHRRALERARRRRGTVSILVLALVVLVLLFVIRNSQSVPVDLVFTTAEIPLIWVIIGCLGLGGVVGFVIGRPGRAFRFHDPGRGRDEERGDR